MEITIPDHTMYFSGYLDAVGRVYTTEEELVSLTSAIVHDKASVDNEYGVEIAEEKVVSEMVASFEKSVSEFLSTDPTERLVFYLVEYFMWFQEYSESCVCKECTLKWKASPDRYLAYKLRVNDDYNVLVILSASKKRGKNA